MPRVESREVIRARMLKEIARIWGYNESEMDVTGFDPLVNLLVSACSVEFERISQEMQDSSSRVLQRLVSLLTPDVFTGALPAHAIVHARSVEPEVAVGQSTQLSCRWESMNTIKDLHFSPILSSKIYNADVSFMACGNKIYQVKDILDKEVVLESRDKRFDRSSLWIGLEVGKGVQSVAGMHFFFDWKLNPNKQHHLELLPFGMWYSEGELLETRLGVPGVERSQAATLLDQTNVIKRMEERISTRYNRHYIQIEDGPNAGLHKKKRQYPNEFQKVFSVQELTVIKDEYVWIKVVFPESFSESALDSIYCYLNCFPVLNWKAIEKYFSLKSNINILPLKSEDYFFHFRRLYNASGYYYQFANSLDLNHYKAGDFTIRAAGVGRYDARNASEMVSDLLDKLRDESTAFSAMELDLFSSDIKDLDHIVRRIQKKVTVSNKNSEPVHYLIVKPKDESDTVYADYWTTTGAFANGVPARTSLDLEKEASLRRDSILLVTTTEGGRNKLPPEDSLAHYKEALMTRGRIVTREDVRIFCLAHLEDRVSKVEVKKGCRIDPRPGYGLTRTLDVVLTPTDKSITEEEWRQLSSQLQRNLERASTGVLPFRIIVKTD